MLSHHPHGLTSLGQAAPQVAHVRGRQAVLTEPTEHSPPGTPNAPSRARQGCSSPQVRATGARGSVTPGGGGKTARIGMLSPATPARAQ